MRSINRIVVAGVGGIGYWLLWCLCRDLAGTGVVIEAYDPDNFVGGSGHRRLPKVSRPELKKVELLTMQIRNIMGDTLHKARATPLTPVALRTGDWTNTLVIDATDAPRDDRDELWATAREVGARIIRASYEGRTEDAGGLAVVSTSLPFQKTGDNGGNYNSTPDESLSFLAAGLAACMVLEMLRAGVIKDIQIELPFSPSAVFEDEEDNLLEVPVTYCAYPTCTNEVVEEGTYCDECMNEEEEI